MTRTQFSTGCAQITLDQIKTLVESFGYSQREIFTLAIEQFHNSKIRTDTINMSTKRNVVLSDETSELVDALADCFQIPDEFYANGGVYSDDARDKAINAALKKLLRQTGNEHIIKRVENAS